MRLKPLLNSKIETLKLQKMWKLGIMQTSRCSMWVRCHWTLPNRKSIGWRQMPKSFKSITNFTFLAKLQKCHDSWFSLGWNQWRQSQRRGFSSRRFAADPLVIDHVCHRPDQNKPVPSDPVAHLSKPAYHYERSLSRRLSREKFDDGSLFLQECWPEP